MTLISTACSWVNIDGQKTVSFAHVGQIYFGGVGQYYFGGDIYLTPRAVLPKKEFLAFEYVYVRRP